MSRKIIGAINMTIDGFCDHTAMIADDDLHRHYNKLIGQAGTLLYGRITYQLMEAAWPPLVQQPSGNAELDEFARLIDNIDKRVFSNSLTSVSWRHTQLIKGDPVAVIRQLKNEDGPPVLAGSPSLIATLLDAGSIDELQLAIHPVVLGSGKTLFAHIHQRLDLHLIATETLPSGVMVLYYEKASASRVK